MLQINVVYKKKDALVEDIYGHLIRCSENFIPPLSGRVNIEDYSNKIFRQSVTYEAWFANKLIGLVAVYFSDFPGRLAFITNVSVESQYVRIGIPSKLLSDCIAEAKDRRCASMELEVDSLNAPAIKLYEKFNFIISGNVNGVIRMTLPLK